MAQKKGVERTENNLLILVHDVCRYLLVDNLVESVDYQESRKSVTIVYLYIYNKNKQKRKEITEERERERGEQDDDMVGESEGAEARAATFSEAIAVWK